jgi:hypothetical protein
MPNLRTPDVQDWLVALHGSLGPGDWPPPIRAIEARDGHPQLLADLGVALDAAANQDASAVAALFLDDLAAKELRPVLAQLGAARLLRILHWALEHELPDSHGIIPRLLTGDDAETRALLAALCALTRRIILHRIFLPQRIAALEAACAQAQEEDA